MRKQISPQRHKEHEDNETKNSHAKTQSHNGKAGNIRRLHRFRRLRLSAWWAAGRIKGSCVRTQFVSSLARPTTDRNLRNLCNLRILPLPFNLRVLCVSVVK
jgi:hypothetical protein